MRHTRNIKFKKAKHKKQNIIKHHSWKVEDGRTQQTWTFNFKNLNAKTLITKHKAIINITSTSERTPKSNDRNQQSK